MRQSDQGTARCFDSYHVMKAKAHKSKSDQHDDDMWTWLVIGLIFGAVSLTLYGPLVWQMARGSL